MNMIHLSRAEYNTLSTIGTLTKGGVTYTFDPINNEYIVPTTIKYQHNIVLQQSQSASPYIVVVFSVSITNDSPDAIDTTTKLYNELVKIIPNGSNNWYPVNFVQTKSSGTLDRCGVYAYTSQNFINIGNGRPATHTLLNSNGQVFDGSNLLGGGAPIVRDIVTEL